jgi:hypothetical protein
MAINPTPGKAKNHIGKCQSPQNIPRNSVALNVPLFYSIGPNAYPIHPISSLNPEKKKAINGMMNATMGTGAVNSSIQKIVATPQLIKKSIGIKRRARVYPFFYSLIETSA